MAAIITEASKYRAFVLVASACRHASLGCPFLLVVWLTVFNSIFDLPLEPA